MDRQLIEQKLASLARCVKRVESRCLVQGSELSGDLDSQDVAALNLTRAIGLCVDVALLLISTWGEETPSSMASSFEPLVLRGIITPDMATELRHAVGFRNVIVHNYEAVNWGVVQLVIASRLALFKDFAARVMACAQSA